MSDELEELKAQVAELKPKLPYHGYNIISLHRKGTTHQAAYLHWTGNYIAT